jgi:hypothetical protein
MKLTKEYIRKLIKEQAKLIDFNAQYSKGIDQNSVDGKF